MLEEPAYRWKGSAQVDDVILRTHIIPLEGFLECMGFIVQTGPRKSRTLDCEMGAVGDWGRVAGMESCGGDCPRLSSCMCRRQNRTIDASETLIPFCFKKASISAQVAPFERKRNTAILFSCNSVICLRLGRKCSAASSSEGLIMFNISGSFIFVRDYLVVLRSQSPAGDV